MSEIAFNLIGLFHHVQIQEPTNRSTATRAFAFLAKFAETMVMVTEAFARMNVAPVASL